MDKRNRIRDLVYQSVENLVEHESFRTWLNSQSTKEGNVLFNNSFIFRQNLKTTKNARYLVASIDESRKVTNIHVVRGITTNSDYKFLSPSSTNYTKELLEDSITDLMSKLGKLVFVLVGEIDSHIVSEKQINSKFLEKVVLDSSLKEDSIDSGVLRIRDTFDEEAIWDFTRKELSKEAEFNGCEDEVREKLGNALVSLEAESYSELTIPTDFDNETKYVLDLMADAMDEQADQYRNALDGFRDSDRECNRFCVNGPYSQ